MWSRSRLHDDDDRTVTAGQAGGCWGGRVHGQYRPGTQSRALTRVPHTTSTDWLMEGDLWSQLTGGPIIQTWLISWSEQRKISENSTTWSCRRVCARDYRHVWGLFSEGVGHVTCNQDTHIGSSLTCCAALWQDAAPLSNFTLRSLKGVGHLKVKVLETDGLQAVVEDRCQNHLLVCSLAYCQI